MTTDLLGEYRRADRELAAARGAVFEAVTPEDKLRHAGVWLSIAVRRARLYEAVLASGATTEQEQLA